MLWLLLTPALHAHDLDVHPFLQHMQPTSAWIVWETSGGEESTVEWGLSPSLGETTAGAAKTGQGASRIHEVQLTGLSPATLYYYRILTEDVVGDVHHFRTPAEPAAEEGFRIVAMSDMQEDFLHPNKFHEVVHDGVLDYVYDHFGLDVAEEVGLVLIPGDLVAIGGNYNSWQNGFFGPISDLAAEVPLYPVPGNHEGDTPAFFKYFTLPDNGTSGYLEHWWYTDWSNVRVIGLDTNSGYRIQTQLDWLEGVLDDAALNPDVDFVFAQLHHPHKSELWVSGELDYTGDIIDRLSTFSTDTGKPSIHFFGHTHGYSRGQQRDHTHLMVDVASAGGNVDYWGEYSQYDYDEFTVSHDDYGFVVVEVEAGADPRFELTRVSRGNIPDPRDNEVRDQVSVRRYNDGPDRPEGLLPAGADVNPACRTLSASPYVDIDGDLHGASHWQLAPDCTFSSLLLDRWKQHENWYADENTQAGDDLTDELAGLLEEHTDYCWRVRYRDRSLAWSEWSDAVAFSTGVMDRTANLLSNPGAEYDLADWTITSGVVESLTSGQCSGTSPFAGSRYFAVGGMCTHAGTGRAEQVVDLSAWAARIDAGEATGFLNAWLSTYSGDDVPGVELTFQDDSGTATANTVRLATTAQDWTLIAGTMPVPVGTRQALVVLTGDRNSGQDTDAYIDELSLMLEFAAADDCSPAPAPGDTGDTGLVDSGTGDTGLDTDDTDEPEDTDQADTDTPSDSGDPQIEDTDEPESNVPPAADGAGEEGGCGCQQNVAGTSRWLPSVVGAIRRRR